MKAISKNGGEWIFSGALLFLIILLSETPHIMGEKPKMSINPQRSFTSSTEQPKAFDFKPDPANPYPACKNAIQTAALYKEVFEVLHPWTLRPENQSKDLPDAISLVCQCLRNLKRIPEIDSYLNNIAKIHSKNWLVLQRAANLQRNIGIVWGSIQNGEFIRGNHNGKQVFSGERDFVRALQLMTAAEKILIKELEAIEPDFFKKRTAKYNEHGYFTRNDLEIFARPVNVNPQHEKLLEQAFDFYTEFASFFNKQYWQLQILTDFSRLPDYTQEMNYDSYRSQAPVNSQGNPVFYDLPDSFKNAKNDGQRQRFLWHRATLCLPKRQENEWMNQIYLLTAVFSVETLRDYSSIFGRTEIDSGDYQNSTDSTKKEKPSGIWDLQTLEDNETIARLASGIKRFKLPDNQNYIFLLKKILQHGQNFETTAVFILAKEYKNRRQYEKAAEILRQQIEKTKPGFLANFMKQKNKIRPQSKGEYKVQQSKGELPQEEFINQADPYANMRSSMKNLVTEYLQIVGNWGQFEPTRSSAAGEKQKPAFRFRNGSHVTFNVRRINIDALLTDVKENWKSRKLHEAPDFSLINMEQIGFNLINNKANNRKYLSQTVAEWSLDLLPEKDHFDKKILIDLPIQEGGAYLIKSEMADGNSDTVIAWLDDFAIVTKNLNNAQYYYVAEAASGKPVSDADFDFWGLTNSRFTNSNTVYWQLKEFKKKSDSNGELIIDDSQKLAQNGNSGNWFVTVSKMIDGRKHLAFMGIEPFWFASRNESSFEKTAAYFISDRPVYRPEQEIKFKFWTGNASYKSSKLSDWSKKKVRLTIKNPRNEKILEKFYVLDSFGGLADKITLDKSVPLGNYEFYLEASKSNFPSNLFKPDAPFESREIIWLGGGSVRLEEYKKPEYEVMIQAPKDPVSLGGKIKVNVEAKYYFGAPVADAKVKYTVLRKKHSANWYPIRPWDWFYGNGYAWFLPDSSWYPGWRTWGCHAPLGYGINPYWESPEVIAQETGTIGSDGKFEIEINTESAKLLYPDSNQEYSISVEVTDQSRRTVYGEGTVLAAPDPFKVYTWLDRGFYMPNDQLCASVQARRIDGKPVSGQAVVKIFRIEYAKDSKTVDNSAKSRSTIQPVETEIHRASLTLKEEGNGSISLKAPKSGQYRLSCSVTDSNGRKIEGGSLFTVNASGELPADDLHFNNIELITEKAEYAPGETARLLINTDRKDAVVLLFLRSVNGICNPPQTIRMNGQTKIVEIKIKNDDMPNIFIEALTVSSGKVYSVQKELVVPPEKKILNLSVIPNKQKYRPGEKAKADLFVTDLQGKPVSGQMVVSIYDKSIEYISGGYHLNDIKEFFWKWRRSSQVNYKTNLNKIYFNITSDPMTMSLLGIFDDLLLKQVENQNEEMEQGLRGRKNRMFSAGLRERGMPVSSMAPMSDALALNAAAPDSPSDASKRKRDENAYDGQFDREKSVLGKSASESDYTMAGAGKAMGEPVVRKNFADTAFWTAELKTDQNGKAQIELEMPENLTTWKIRAWTFAEGTRVGEGSTEVVTGKDLIIRMQKPRFLIQGDQTVFSANVHNYLSTEKEVEVALILPNPSKDSSKDHSQANLNAEQTLLVLDEKEKSVHRIKIKSQAEQRIDWHLIAKQTGTAAVQMSAKTDEESDALEETIPVYVHGILKQEAISGMIAARSQTEAEKNNEKTVSANFAMTVPEKRRPEESVLTVRFSPTLAGAMLDAIPYLTDYPYGCTEQTLNRFVPTLIARKTLQDSGITLKDLAKKQANLNAQELSRPADRAAQWKHQKSDRNPVFDENIVLEMTAQGLKKLNEMQCNDGGWGWFSGPGETSSPHLTAQVVHGLLLARSCDVKINQNVINSGIQWLKNYQKEQTKKLLLGKILTDRQKTRQCRDNCWKNSPDDLDALVFSVLAEALAAQADNHSITKKYPVEIKNLLDKAEANRKNNDNIQNENRTREDTPNEESDGIEIDKIIKVLNKNLNDAFTSCYMKNRLWDHRANLSRLSISLFGLGLLAEGKLVDQENGNGELIDDLIRMLSQFIKEDPENQTAYLDLGGAVHYWWRWYGNDIETQAHFLKLLVSRNPKSEIAPRLVKYLLNNRKNAVRWNSTRDTAYCLEAFAKYLSVTKELDPKTTVEVLIDGQIKKKIDINANNLFLIDNTVEMKGTALQTGQHEICLRQTGTGPLYYNAYLKNFTMEDFIKKTGLEVKITRNYYRLTEKKDATGITADARGGIVSKRIEKWEQTLLKQGAEIKSGDLIEVELLIACKNDYDSILIEDRKPAGLESVELRSGYNGNALGAYVEFRDDRVCFFVSQLKKGNYAVTYRLKAEQPGHFSALPAVIWGMYAPELKGNADEFRVKISD